MLHGLGFKLQCAKYEVDIDSNAGGGVAELCISIFAREAFRLTLLPESLALLGRLG